MSDLTDFLVLLLISNRDYYAYELIGDIEKLSDGCISVNSNTVYTALYRLSDSGCIREYSVRVGRKRTRVYYSIEQPGMDQLFELYKEYKKIAAGVDNILNKLKITEESNDNDTKKY